MTNTINFFLMLYLISSTAFAQRTVFDNDRGNYYQYPYNFDFTLYGGFGSQPRQSNNIKPYGFWHRMFEETIKSPHARFQHFDTGDSIVNNFPIKEFTKYASDEKRQGKVNLWATKTVGTHIAKVQFSYTGFAFAENPIFDVVHFADLRYVKYFANEFARAILHGDINYGKPVDEPYGPNWKNLIIGIDNYDWNYSNYGYINAGGAFIYGTGFSWDDPYPQNLTQLQDAVISFQTQLKKYAPDVPIMVNGGGVKDTTTYDTMFKGLEGKFFEEFMCYFAKGYWDRVQIYWQLQTAKWMATNNKITIFQGEFDTITNSSFPSYESDIRTMTCAYLIARSHNSFFGMAKDTTAAYEFREIKAEKYQYIKDDMGLPKAPFTLTLTDNDVAYGLYKRQYDGGWVFLNLTGVAQTIPLGGTYYDRAGNAITSFTIADYTGDYVRTAPQIRPQMVAINNRYSKPISGIVPIRMSCGTADVTIRYTTDGTLPTNSSSIYTTPIELSVTTTVKAIAFKSGLNPSFVNTADYNISATPPIISFNALSDTVTEYLKNGFALVKLSKLCSSPVNVNFEVTGSATFGKDYNLTNGTITFLPFEPYKVIRIPVIDDFLKENLETVRLTLSSPVNATLGSQSLFDYYIQDNEIGSLSISDNNHKNNLTIFPNPFSDTINITASKIITNLKIISASGQIILSKKNNQKSCVLAIPDVANGFYVLEVVFEDGSKENVKLLKE